MLHSINFTTAIYPALMFLTSVGTFIVSIVVVRRSNKKFQKEQMDAKADITFVERENKRIEEEFDLKLAVVKQWQEEMHTIFDKMSRQINFIYEKHYKP